MSITPVMLAFKYHPRPFIRDGGEDLVWPYPGGKGVLFAVFWGECKLGGDFSDPFTLCQ